MKLFKCVSCGALISVIDECNCPCGFNCCDKKMIELKANSEDASFEKHLPQYTVVEDKIEVVVPHVMEEEHYIELIAYLHDNVLETVKLNYTDEAKATFIYYPNSTLYSYCNKHNLWKTDVE